MYNNQNYSIPKRGGNWTLYFVCSDGSRIIYESNHSGEFYCQSTNETLRGEKYTSSWTAYRHREIITDFALCVIVPSLPTVPPLPNEVVIGFPIISIAAVR